MAFKKKGPKKKKEEEKAPRLPDLRSEGDLAKVYAKMGEFFCTDFNVEFWPTGSFALDYLWCGGLARGRITEVASAPGCGKTTLAVHVMNAICKMGEHVVYVDSEHAVSNSLVTGSKLMQYYGKNFWYVQLQTYDQLDWVFEQYLGSSRQILPAVIVVDSISSIQTTAQQEEGHKHIKIGGDSKPCGDFLRKWKGQFARLKVAMFLINQCRENINTTGFRGPSAASMGGSKGLKPWGGKALQHWGDNRTWLEGDATILKNAQDPDSLIGRDLKIWTTKNKQGPMRRGLLSLIFGKGISETRTLRNWLVDAGLIEVGGSWYTPIESLNPEGTRFQGQRKLEMWIADNYERLITTLKSGGYLDEDPGQ